MNNEDRGETSVSIMIRRCLKTRSTFSYLTGSKFRAGEDSELGALAYGHGA